nr:unnamed protein product [Digitaria exilis]
MEKAILILVILTASMATTSLFVTANACAGVPSMPIDAACRAASTSQAMYDLCTSILQSSPPNSDLATYAVSAAGAAALSCDSAADASVRMLQDGSVSGDMRDACSACVDDYHAAHQGIAGAADQLGQCAFQNVRQGYMDALSSIEDCTAKLVAAGGTTTTLYAMAVGVRDRTAIALPLGTAIGA